MALRYKTRKRLSFLILLVFMPLYVIVAVNLVELLDRSALPVWVEFAMFAVLGVAWVFPFKAIFRGTAKPDPDAPDGAEAPHQPFDHGDPRDR